MIANRYFFQRLFLCQRLSGKSLSAVLSAQAAVQRKPGLYLQLNCTAEAAAQIAEAAQQQENSRFCHMRCRTAIAVCVCAAAPARAFFAAQTHISATRLGAGVVRRRSCAASALSMVTLPKGALYQSVSALSYCCAQTNALLAVSIC
jgi:hypothetical protein